MTQYNFSGGTDTLMSVNGLHCVFNMPKAVRSKSRYEIRLTLLNEDKVPFGQKFNTAEEAEGIARGLRESEQYRDVEVLKGEEELSGLPPYAPRKAFKVDEYHCPINWMHGSALANSYFVPIEVDHGMWLDFNKNFDHTHHVAVLISVQGINPIDGQSMVDGAMHLRQYKTKCPTHDVEFGADRYCPKCGYKWAPQNYLCTTGTSGGSLWLDGFLASDGVVRQYYFTEDEARGVAHQVLGAEKKVYSIGVAFYLSKEPKPIPTYKHVGLSFGSGKLYDNVMKDAGGPVWYHDGDSVLGLSCDAGGPACHYDSSACASGDKALLKGTIRKDLLKRTIRSRGFSSSNYEESEVEVMKTFDIAAGAKINQKVYADPNNLDFWQEKPAGVLYINYTPSEQAVSILKKGKRDLTKGGEGFLAGLKTGTS